MKKVKLSALLFGATLFVGMGVTSLSAEMKCGAGKCGSSSEKQKKYMDRDSGKCGGEKKEMYRDKGTMRDDGKCGDSKKGMMRDDGKSGDSKKGMMRDDKMPNKNMKSQDGRCGSN